MSLLGATILTAIATVVLAVGAIVTAVFAWLAFRKQSQEVGLLLEQNKRDTDERRRAQAAQVFLAVHRNEGRLAVAYVHNASELPIYDARIAYGLDSTWEPEDLGLIMPGDQVSATRQLPADQALQDSMLTFRDAPDIRWTRTTGGFLRELESLPRAIRDLL